MTALSGLATISRKLQLLQIPNRRQGKRGELRKAEIVQAVAAETGLTLVKSEAVIDAIIAEIKATLSQGEPVVLRRFGTFEARAKAAREGRNPKTGEPAAIEARRAMRFKAGRNFRAAINGEGAF